MNFEAIEKRISELEAQREQTYEEKSRLVRQIDTKDRSIRELDIVLYELEWVKRVLCGQEARK